MSYRSKAINNLLRLLNLELPLFRLRLLTVDSWKTKGADLLPLFKPTQVQWMLAYAFSTMLFVIALPANATSVPQQDMQRLDGYIKQAVTKANAQDLPGAAATYQKYDRDWFDVEDGVKKTSRQTYRDIESAMNEVKFAFLQKPLEQSQVVAALLKLEAIDQKFIAGGSTLSAETTPTSTSKVTIASLIERLNRAEVAINKQDNATAADQIKGFQTDWLEVEGIVKTKSKQAYVDVENNMTKAYGFLKANPADVTGASAAIASLVFSGDEVAAKVKKIELLTKPLTSASTSSGVSSATTSTTASIQPGLTKFKGFVK